jgi:hypothetical protein
MSKQMVSLDGLQNRFQHYLLEEDPAFLREIAGADDAYRQTRLGIYYTAYRLRLVATLAVDYEILKAFVGESRFGEIALAYVHTHPSTFRNLRWYGASMADFLREDARFKDEPVLSQLAEFEWAHGLAFDATDAPHLSFDDLAAVPPENWADIRFTQHPSLCLVTPNWNVVDIWHAHKDGKNVPAAVSSEQANVIAVWRRDYKSYFRTLETDESILWRMLANGTSFGEACAELPATTNTSEEDAPLRAAQLLRGWVDAGWIQSYEIAQTS